MADVIKNLEESWAKRKEEARNRAQEAVRELQKAYKSINFNSVHECSGVSKSFLYDDPESRKLIEECRAFETEKAILRHRKYDKTARSKDVIIDAKDKRIAKLEAENRKLKHEIELLRGLLYSKK